MPRARILRECSSSHEDENNREFGERMPELAEVEVMTHFNNVIKAYDELAADANELAKADEIAFDEPKEPEQLMVALNSDPAKKFKAAWMRLKDWANVFSEMPEELGIGAQNMPEYVQIMMLATMGKVAEARTKVCVMLMLRAMARGLKPSEARPDVIEQARKSIEEIGGDLSVVGREVLRCRISEDVR